MGKRRRALSAFSIASAVLVGSPCWAATVAPGSGDLSINHGQGFKPVTSAAQAKVGDSVMVSPGGTATLTYDDGCKVDVRPGAVMTVAPLSPCAARSNAQDGDPNWGGWAVGLATAAALGFGVYEATRGQGTIAAPKPASP